MDACNPNFTPTGLADARRESFLLTVGAQDTTASFISSLLHLIITHPRIYAILLAEISQANLSPIPLYDETCQLTYFMACVQESLRLASPVCLPLPRYAPLEGMVLNGILVGKGAEVGANPYVIHSNKEIYGEDAESFRPERWLEATPEQLRYVLLRA